FALFRRDPELLLGFRFWHRRLADDRCAASSHVTGIRALIGIPVWPQHPIAQDDEQLVTIQRLRVQHSYFIAEIDRNAELPVDGPAQAGSDVVAIVIAVAN